MANNKKRLQKAAHEFVVKYPALCLKYWNCINLIANTIKHTQKTEVVINTNTLEISNNYDKNSFNKLKTTKTSTNETCEAQYKKPRTIKRIRSKQMD